MSTAKVWIMAKKFAGEAKPSDFSVIQEQLQELNDGDPHFDLGEIIQINVNDEVKDYRVQANVWSTDPYNKVFMQRLPEGTPMIGFQAGEVIESKNNSFPKGSHAVTHTGWRTLSNVSGSDANVFQYRISEDLLKNHSLSYFVGALGMPGATAYFGLIHCCKPKAGETLVVNAAAGAVGNLVGQFAKIMGLTVIGYAGSDEKCAWLKTLGFDHAINYKTENLAESLKKYAPKGVDCFYDNVGGDFAITVYEHMNQRGRICQCGSISAYNNEGETRVKSPFMYFVLKELCLTGFIFHSYVSMYQEFIDQVSQWIEQGKVKCEETVYNSFEEMPTALIEQIRGKNIGKVVVRNQQPS